MGEQKLPRGIRRRGEKFFVDVSHAGSRRTATCETLEEAITEQQRLKYELRAGQGNVSVREGRSWTLRKAVDRTWAVDWKYARSADHLKMNAEAAVAFFGADAKLHTITVSRLDDWIKSMEEAGNANATINRKLAALSKVFSVAVERGGVKTKPKFPRKHEGHGRIRWVTAEEEKKLLEYATHFGMEDAREAIIVLIDTGMRLGEFERLEARDVDFRTGMVALWETKADLPRSIPMTDRVRTVLETRATRYPKGRLFPFKRTSFRQWWQRLRSTLGLSDDPQFVPHVLRHTCASRLVQRGVSIPVVQQWMGHKTITVTMRYAHLAPANLAAAAQVLEASKSPVLKTA